MRLILPQLPTLLLAPGWALLWLSPCIWQAICSSMDLFEQWWHHKAFLLKMILKIAAIQKTEVDQVPNPHIYPTNREWQHWAGSSSRQHWCFSVLLNWELLPNYFAWPYCKFSFILHFSCHTSDHISSLSIWFIIYLTWRNKDHLIIFIIKIHKTFQ